MCYYLNVQFKGQRVNHKSNLIAAATCTYVCDTEFLLSSICADDKKISFYPMLSVGVTLEGGGRGKREKLSPPIFFLPKNSFLFATEFKTGKQKNKKLW